MAERAVKKSDWSTLSVIDSGFVQSPSFFLMAFHFQVLSLGSLPDRYVKFGNVPSCMPVSGCHGLLSNGAGKQANSHDLKFIVKVRF